MQLTFYRHRGKLRVKLVYIIAVIIFFLDYDRFEKRCWDRKLIYNECIYLVFRSYLPREKSCNGNGIRIENGARGRRNLSLRNRLRRANRRGRRGRPRRPRARIRLEKIAMQSETLRGGST